MAIVNGNKVGLYVDNVLIGCLTSNDFNSTFEEIIATCKDNNGAKQVLAGTNSADFPFSGNFEPAGNNYTFQDLVGIHKNQTRVGVKMYDATSASGGFYITAYAKLLTLSWSAPLNAASTFSGTFTVDGGWDYGTDT